MKLDADTIQQLAEALRPSIEGVIDRKMEGLAALAARQNLPHGFGLQPRLLAPQECKRVSTIMRETLEEMGGEAVVKDQTEADKEARDTRVCFVNPYTPPEFWNDADKLLMQSVFIRMVGFGHISQASVLRNEVPILAPYPSEMMQFTEYSVGMHYGFHADDDKGNQEGRACSMSLLIDGAKEGGDFEFRDVPFTEPFDEQIKARGNAIAFRPSAVHQVTKVTAGVRRSIVLWMDSLASRQKPADE